MKRGKRNSITFRIGIAFFGFAIILLVATWFLQVFFIDHFYEEMKTERVETTATEIERQYKVMDSSEFYGLMNVISDEEDMYIRIDTGGQVIYPLLESERKFDEEITNAPTPTEIGSKTIIANDNQDLTRRSMVYSKILDPQTSTVIYIVAPLYPISSTIDILQNQMLFVVLIALIFALVFAAVLARHLSKPIKAVSASAKKLAMGQYGVVFNEDSKYSEVCELAETFNRMSCELERSVMLQKDLMANVSHDLRTPLTMIKSYAEMVRDLSGDNPEKREEHLNIIMDEADRLNLLVKDIMAITALQSGTMALDIKTFDIREVAERVLQTHRILEEQENFKLEFNCRPSSVWVKGDGERIEQVLTNFVTNGIKYCGTDRKVILNIKCWGRKMHCEVIDHGMGIKPEEMEHIWERYYQSSSNHVRSAMGTGLGLSIVKEILSLHGAPFGVESKVGKGTTFWFELNMAPAPGFKEEKNRERQEKESDRRGVIRRGKVRTQEILDMTPGDDRTGPKSTD